MQLPTGTVTFLFSDIEGSTRLLQRLGDGYPAVQDDHAHIMRQAIEEGGGVVIKTEGDSFFAVFADHTGAVHAAVAAQRALAAHPWPHGTPLRVRMGLHTGEVIAEEGDFFGKNVILAARIAAQAGGGEILVSDTLKAAADDDDELDLSFDEGRELELKGLAGTHRVYRADWQAQAAATS